MKPLIWLLLIAATGVFAYGLWNARRRWHAHRRAAEERLASFVMQAHVDSHKSSKAPDKDAPD